MDVRNKSNMNESIARVRRRRRRILLPIIAGIVLFVIQLSGNYSAGLGYGLLLVSVVFLLAGTVALAILVFSSYGQGNFLAGSMRWLFVIGGWAYVIGVFDLSGYYSAQALAGQVELKWILFGPTALMTLVLLDIGLYHLVYAKNRPAWRRYRDAIQREYAEPDAMRKTFLADVIFHTSLLSVSGFRWLRHTLMFWGFALMFAVEIVAVFVREGFPAFGWVDIWEIAEHPVRLGFDFAFDFFGLMVLAGCLLSFIWRIKASNTDEAKYADTPSAVFLFLVVLTGFLLEGGRLALEGIPAGSGYSFVGWVFAQMSAEKSGLLASAYLPLWYFHVFGSLAFIIYVPAYRLAHSCATPIGRLMNSQKKLLARKKENSLRGLMPGNDGNLTPKKLR